MSSVGTHLLRRGLDAHAYMGEKEVKINLPPWVIAMLALTALVFMFVMFMIEYTFGRVIPTLMMIEEPQDNTDFEPLPAEDNDDSIIKDPEPPTSPAPRFITSTFRSSIKLLHSKGGFKSRFRGVSIFLVNAVAIQWVTSFLSAVTGHFLPIFIYAGIATVLCAQLSLGWTLIVISEPSPQPWYHRVPSIKMWKKIAGPTAIYALASQIAAGIPFLVAALTGLVRDPKEIADLPAAEQRMFVAKIFAVVDLCFLLTLCLVLPVRIALTRTQASLLSDEQESIVSFDRTFGGKVIPEIVGGSGMVGMLDAWNTFDWAARVRILKAYAKVVCMVFAVCILFTTVMTAQIVLFGGDIHKIFVPADGSN